MKKESKEVHCKKWHVSDNTWEFGSQGLYGLLTTPFVFSSLYLFVSLNESYVVGHGFKPGILYID